jgi:hypothetical protein
MYSYDVTIPRADNHGAAFPAEVIAGVESTLLDTFGGFTATDARGAWRFDGADYIEPVTIYRCDSIDARADDVQRIADTFAELLGQHELYVPTTAPDGARDVIIGRQRDILGAVA